MTLAFQMATRIVHDAKDVWTRDQNVRGVKEAL